MFKLNIIYDLYNRNSLRSWQGLVLMVPAKPKFDVGLYLRAFYGFEIFIYLVAFKLHDFDEDGKISRDDLRQYIKLVTDFGDNEQKDITKVDI